MHILDFSFVSALAGPRIQPVDSGLREALVAATADGEDTRSTSHHADFAYVMQAAADRRRSRPGPHLQDLRAASTGALELAWAED